jgi:DNA-binding NarL/FixJ family response regulator
LSEPVRILLVEDNQVFREALELLLELRPEIQVVASVGDGSEAVPACKAYEPHVVLMDYRLPGLDGVHATTAVKTACPEVAVVCLTASANAAEMKALRAAGATTCLTKDTELDSIVDALVAAARSTQ